MIFGFDGIPPWMRQSQPDRPTPADRMPIRVVAAMQHIQHVNHSVTDRQIWSGESQEEVTRDLTPKEQAAYAAALELVQRYFQGEQYPDADPPGPEASEWTQELPISPGQYVFYSAATRKLHAASAINVSAGTQIMVHAHPPTATFEGWWIPAPKMPFLHQIMSDAARFLRTGPDVDTGPASNEPAQD